MATEWGGGLSSHIFRRCVEDSSDAIMLTDDEGRLVYVNPSWSKLYGYSSAEALGEKASLLHSGLHDPAFYQTMWRDILSSEKGYWCGEVVNRAKNGELKTVLLTISPYRPHSAEDPIEGFMGIAVDRTAAKEMEERLAQQDKLVLLGTLAGALAHEIGTPLGVMRGRAEMLLEGARQGPSEVFEGFAKDASSILEQVDRVSKVMTRILGFARSGGQGSGSDLAEPKKSVIAVFEDVEALVDGHFRRSGVELEIVHRGGNLYTASASCLEQILINLLLNGVRALDKVEPTRLRRVILELGREESGDPELEEPGWYLAVEDTGSGVPEELRLRIFEPFFTTVPAHGTGLGLAISAKIAADIGGRLALESSVRSSHGARFVLHLPARFMGESRRSV